LICARDKTRRPALSGETGGGLALLAGTMLVLAGCAGTSSVQVDARFPEPVVAPLPLRMGVHLPEALRGYTHEEEIPRHSSWRFELGAANVNLFQPVFGAMFEEVVPVDRIPPQRGDAGRLDGIVRPTLETFQFDIPRTEDNEFVEVWVEYKLELYTPEGGLIAEWPVSGYGRSREGNFSQDRSLSEATVEAMREVGAELSIGFASLPEVSDWLEDLGYEPSDTQVNGASAAR